jgi:hypothetical protein
MGAAPATRQGASIRIDLTFFCTGVSSLCKELQQVIDPAGDLISGPAMGVQIA